MVQGIFNNYWWGLYTPPPAPSPCKIGLILMRKVTNVKWPLEVEERNSNFMFHVLIFQIQTNKPFPVEHNSYLCKNECLSHKLVLPCKTSSLQNSLVVLFQVWWYEKYKWMQYNQLCPISRHYFQPLYYQSFIAYFFLILVNNVGVSFDHPDYFLEVPESVRFLYFVIFCYWQFLIFFLD